MLRHLILFIAKPLNVLRFKALLAGFYRGLFKLLPTAKFLYQLRIVAFAFELLQGPVNFISFIYNYS